MIPLDPGVCCWMLQHSINKREVSRMVYGGSSYSFSFIAPEWLINFCYCPWCGTKLGGKQVTLETEKL